MWRNVKLDDLFRVGSSKRVLKSQWQTEGVPFYRGREVTRLSKDGFVKNELFISEDLYKEYSEKYGVPQSGDIVITAIGTIGNSYIVRDRDRFYFKDASVLWLNKTSNVSSELINYWLQTPLMKKQLYEGIGATVDTLTIKKLQSLKVKLPDLAEQKRIVAILDKAFAGIETAIANTEKNLANARELFESYLNSMFSQGDDRWNKKPLSEICGITSSLVDPRESEFRDLNHVGAGNIISITGELINVQIAREEGLKSGKFVFDESMVLYSKIRPYLRKVARPEFNGLCSADIYPLTPDTELLYRDFLYYLLLSKSFTDYAIAGSARAGMPKVNREHLFGYSAVLPDIEEQKRLVESLDAVALEAKHLESIYQQKLTALAELKQSLLQKAFSGELTAEPQPLKEEEVA